MGLCKKTALSRARPAPSAFPSVAMVKMTPSASLSNFESKMGRAMVSIAASLTVAFCKTEGAKGRQRALEKSTLLPFVSFDAPHISTLVFLLVSSLNHDQIIDPEVLIVGKML